jgi:hydrogenase 3 maturation protease
VGVGNAELGDDGLGPLVAGALAAGGLEDVIVAGTTPERWMEQLASGRYDNVLFVDAVEFEGRPGSAVLLEGSDLRTRLPQISTHKISLGVLADLIERRAPTRVRVLGVKPASLRADEALSPDVHDTARALARILAGVLAGQAGSAPKAEQRSEPVCIGARMQHGSRYETPEKGAAC